MESGTPGVKSTRDGWMNRYLHAKEHAEKSTPFRAVALTQALPRTLQGTAPALAIGQLGQFGVRAGQDTRHDGQRASRRSTRRPPTRCSARPGREAFDAVKMLKDANPGGYAPANGAEYPRSGFGDAMRQIAQIVKADLGLEVAFAELGSGITTRTKAARPARSPTASTTSPTASPPSPATWATAWPTSSS